MALGSERYTGDGRLAVDVFGGHPYGLVVSDVRGRIHDHNAAARRILGHLALKRDRDGVICDLVGCRAPDGPLAEVCAHELASAHEGPLPEVRVDLAGDGEVASAWITVARLPGESGLLLTELRPGMAEDRRRRTAPHWTRGSHLDIRVFGRTEVHGREGPITGRWLSNRAGQILKFLVAQRPRVVSTDELVERLWRSDAASSGKALRYSIHVLRTTLEPDRSANGRGQSAFIVAEPGGYALNRSAIRIDADDFERDVTAGLAALRAGDADGGRARLRGAIALYHGDFLADEPYADWALDERDRLHHLAAEALRRLIDLERTFGTTDVVVELLQRLAAMEPFDEDVHADFFRMLMLTGRRSDAVRRYQSLRRRTLASFGEDVGFRLSDLS